MNTKRLRYDLVVFGASSFVGAILSRYLYQRHGATGELRWAIAGRSNAKLMQLRAELGGKADGLPIVLADADDAASLDRLCGQTRLVVSTVGPYALHGEPLLRACVESGTDYCDLTGEVQWIARMLRRYEDSARRSGSRIVHCCGFDSIPSDLGVWFLQNEARRRYGHPLPQVEMRVKSLRGGVSGGTVASMLQAVDEARRDPAVRRDLADPYSICPPSDRPRVRQRQLRSAAFDAEHQQWIAPFVMSAVNTRIVQRSHALLGQAYGEKFVYDEAVLCGRGVSGRLRAVGTAAGLGGFLLASAIPPSRWLMQRWFLPAPGSGPTPRQQASGSFDLRFTGQDTQGHRLHVSVRGDRDPGYGSTGKMLGEAAVCLAKDIAKSALPGGFWTPASAMGQRLLDRLQAHAGLTFAIAN